MQVERLFDLLERYRINFDKQDALAGKIDGQWKKYSSAEYRDYADFVSFGLMAMGLNPGDRIAIVTNNRPEWNFVDMGSLQAGMVNVPLYPTMSQEDYIYILNHAKPKFLFVADYLLYRKIKHIIEKVSFLEGVFSFSYVEGVRHWLELVEMGKNFALHHKSDLDNIKCAVLPDDVATIIYTSGTTGVPKGVMLTHRNILSNAKATAALHWLNHHHRVISFLPLCHVYERMLNYHFQYKGLSIYYSDMGAIADNMKYVSPHIFGTVPRLLETIYDKIVSRGDELPFLKRHIFMWALALAHQYELTGKSWWYKCQLSLADRLVFHRWREVLGGQVELIISGGAALQMRLARVFWAAGLSVYEGYGLTETSPVIAVNHPAKNEVKLGTVGPVIDGVEVRLSNEGEILCKGPGIMKGYYKAPDLTREVIDEDGWFHTGDIGKLEDGKFLMINDRKKEIFKLSSGKYIAPQMIEIRMKESMFIEQAMVVGENQKFASVLIAPNFHYLHNWAYKNRIEYRDNKELVSLPKVLGLYQDQVNNLNKRLGQAEQIKRFRIVCDEWKPETGELSPTLKLKRSVITDKYQYIINDIYALGGAVEDTGVINRLRQNVQSGFRRLKKSFRY